MLSALNRPTTDPTPIFELFRGSYGTELLTAAVAHFNIFGRLADTSLSTSELQSELGLAERPAVVLFTALKAMGLLVEQDGQLNLTPLAREHLVPGGAFDVGNYVGLAANAPGVLEMVERLKTNRPAGADDYDQGTAFIYREGVASAMESEALARHFTLALAGRAKNVAPALAEAASLDTTKLLLDVGGGTGIYSIACLQKYPNLKALVLDRPEVLKVAEEMANQYGVGSRLTLKPGDMFHDLESWRDPDLPDAILLSNILHDWDVPECQKLVGACAKLLPPGGRLMIHDVFLNDALDGPLPIALYSAALFTLTEGRAYSIAEYSRWLDDAELTPQAVVPTLVHCGVLAGLKNE